MNPLDLVVIAIVALSAVFAFARGFVREALSIIAWVGAAAVTLYGFAWVYGLIEARVQERLLAQVVAGFGLFVASLVVLTLATGVVARAVRLTGLTPIDRTLGFLFGLARGAFLVCLAFLLLDISMPQADTWPSWIRDAHSTPWLQQGADALQGLLPPSLKQKSADAADALLGGFGQATAAEQAKAASGALLTPAPTVAQPGAAAPPAYKAGERRQMDRIINNQR
jgi:membrane protein required for colicin V production